MTTTSNATTTEAEVPTKGNLAMIGQLDSRLVDRLRVGPTLRDWLPSSGPLAKDFAQARQEHHALLKQVADAQTAIEEQRSAWVQEDRERTQELREAYRQRRSPAPVDAEAEARRTTQREAVAQALKERLRAAAEALAAVSDRIVATCQVNEPSLLTDLKAQVGPITQRCQQLQQELAQARAAEFELHQLGVWLQRTADAGVGSMGLQPAPAATSPPASWTPRPEALERPWHQQRDRRWYPDGDNRSEAA